MKSPALSNVNDSHKVHEKWRIKVDLIENGGDNLRRGEESKFSILHRCTASRSLLLCMQFLLVITITMGTYIIIYISDESNVNRVNYKSYFGCCDCKIHRLYHVKSVKYFLNKLLHPFILYMIHVHT